jgi:hypothetical protein
MGKGWPRHFLGAIFAAVIGGGGMRAADADCVAIWTTKLNEPHDYAHHRTDFHPNDQFVLCIRLEQDAFVSVWDVPPQGNASRLYPNVLSHKNNASVLAQKLPAGDKCFGISGTFPLFFPADQGLGQGTLSVAVTKTEELQPTLDDYTIPGLQLKRSAMDQIARTFRNAAECSDRIHEDIKYKIVK